MAARTNQTPAEFCYDYLTGEDGTRMLYFPITNYVHGDHGVVQQMLADPATLVGLAIASGIVPTSGTWPQIVGLVTGVLGALGYTVSRTVVKNG